MKKQRNRLVAKLMAFAMVLTMVLPYLPSVNVFAASKTMAHIVSDSENGNGHFGGATPEAFVLSPESDKFTNEAFSSELKLGSEKADTRARIVLKYQDDSNWAYIGYDPGGWIYEYKSTGMTSTTYGNLSSLPEIVKGDVFTVTVSYNSNAVTITVQNTTKNTNGSASVTDEKFVALQNAEGRVGFGAGTFNTSYTDIYFSDVTVGSKNYTDYSSWTAYNEKADWEPAVSVGETEPDPEPEGDATGRKWITVQGGSNNGGGHSYGNAGQTAPALLLDQTRNTPVGETISLKLRPLTSNNWGVFYTYKDDNNWLYIGYDNSSKWYCQYNINGSGAYPKLTGLSEPVLGEILDMSITVSRENLTVIVNGEKSTQSIQALTPISDSINGTGRPGVKTNGATKVEFSDFKVGTTDCMNDTWNWAASRDGQVTESYTTAVYNVSGKITDVENAPIKNAVVRVDAVSVKTGEDGTYTIKGIEAGEHTLSVSAPGYLALSKTITISADGEKVFNEQLSPKAELDLNDQIYTKISSDYMDVYVTNVYPAVVRYVVNGEEGTPIFRGQEEELKEVYFNDTPIQAYDVKTTIKNDSITYVMKFADEDAAIDLSMTVKISVEDNDLTWEVTSLEKKDGCADIATIAIPQLNLLSVYTTEEDAVADVVLPSTNTTVIGDEHITWEEGFMADSSTGYMYGFLTNGNLSGGVWSNSEVENDKRVVLNTGADYMSLTSAVWYYERGDEGGQARADLEYPVSDLPCAKVCIAGDLNEDNDLDWNDGALAFRDIMNMPYGTEDIKNLVNYRIVMNFAGMTTNPYLETADNIKKVYLATDGLPQAVMLKGYGNEGHDSANSEYADVSEREGGIDDFKSLIKIAHQYNTEVGIHINAQEAYPEAKSFNETMLVNPITGGWGWLDKAHVIDKLWDLSSQARYKRLIQLYDRINGTSFYSGNWDKGEYVKDSQGEITATVEAIKADAATRADNMDFIYLDVWYQNSWETRQIVKEINSLGWRFSTEFGYEGEYDSTWSHWATDAGYGGAALKGWNSEIIRFIRNDQRDTQIMNYPQYGGTADNPLLGGYRLYGFEGWGGDQNFNRYIKETFTENLPTRFLQHYYVTDWENYGEGEACPTGNREKQITLKNDKKDTVVVTRNTAQRSDSYVERTITLNGKKVLDDVKYLLPWTETDNTEKLYHWNLEGGETTWELQSGWSELDNVVVYELSDQGRINPTTVNVSNGTLTLNAKAATAYVVVKGESTKALSGEFGEGNYVVDPGFNGYAGKNDALNSEKWDGDVDNTAVVVEKASTGDQRLAMNSPEKDVKVTTEIRNLKAGTDYVAEVYVANESDAKATLSVNTGTKTVSNYTMKSFAKNTVASDEKHGTYMQRILVSFTAEGTTAELALSRAAGSGNTYWDDIRIVQKTLNNYGKDGSFTQDFESVVEGLYPFVLGATQTGDQVTHLSQLNAPYTQAGWNGRVISDVIDGEWSLKQHADSTGLVYYTIPQNFRFEPGKVYNVEFDYLAGNSAYQMIIGDGATYTAPTTYLPAVTGDEAAHIKMQVVASASGQTWIGLYENGSLAGKGEMGQTDFILDNLRITENTDSVAAVLTKTELCKGEIVDILGQNMENVIFKSSDEKVIKIDTKNFKVMAVGIGTATVTIELPGGETATYEVTVIDGIVTEITKSNAPGMSATANTEETAYEAASAAAAIDGDSSTFWHSNYSSTGWSLSASNPAVLTVDLGENMGIDGFKFQQRPATNNGTVYQYSYYVLNENGEVIAQGEHIAVPDTQRVGAAWIKVELNERAVDARKIKIAVEAGKGGFAAIAEVVPFTVAKVADSVILDVTEKTLNIGDTLKLTAQAVPSGTMLKNLSWSSSDPIVAKVDENGVVTACSIGITTITVSNVAGLKATCVITVNGKNGTFNNPFVDVTKDDYFYNPVLWAVEKEITNGTTPTTFSPNNNCTRAQVVMFLYKNAGAPKVDVSGPNPFSDVTTGGTFYKAIVWAKQNGITNGYTDGTFRPLDPVTRGEYIAFQHRAAGEPEVSFENPFSDVDSNHRFYKAIMWAAKNKITLGRNDKFLPADNCLRGQVVTFLYRACNLEN